MGAVLHRRGQILLGRRSTARGWLPGVWDLPGGHCEAGETPEAALVRELGEELGITARRWEHLTTAEEAGVALHVYRVDQWNGTPWNARPDEHDAIAWMSARDACALRLAHPALCELLHRAVRPR
ncbi:MAG: NUDIX domain-containing protein [Gemmatimonadaceae bacterium]